MRRPFCLVLAVAVLPLAGGMPPAAGQTPLIPADETMGYALAGDEILFTRVNERAVDVFGIPVTAGGPARPERRLNLKIAAEGAQLDASAEVAVLTVSSTRTQQFGGPPGGALSPFGPPQPIRRRTFAPSFAQVDGRRIFTTEIRGDFRQARVTIREPGRPAETVPLPRGAELNTSFAGDLVASPNATSRGENGKVRLVVREWRTGAERWSVPLDDYPESVELADDGRVALWWSGGRIDEIAAGGAGIRTITRDDGESPAYAGDRLVYVREGRRDGDPSRVVVVEPDGTRRPLGVPSAGFAQPVADDRRVLIHSERCLQLVEITAPAADALPPGPCPRTEMTFIDGDQPTLTRTRRIPLVLHCVAAPPPGCRGTVRLEEFDPGGIKTPPARFSAKPGEDVRVVVRFSRRDYLRARAEARRGIGGIGGAVHVVTTEPDGRRTHMTDGHAFDVR